jgi:hypothetical protein
MRVLRSMRALLLVATLTCLVATAVVDAAGVTLTPACTDIESGTQPATVTATVFAYANQTEAVATLTHGETYTVFGNETTSNGAPPAAYTVVCSDQISSPTGVAFSPSTYTWGATSSAAPTIYLARRLAAREFLVALLWSDGEFFVPFGQRLVGQVLVSSPAHPQCGKVSIDTTNCTLTNTGGGGGGGGGGAASDVRVQAPLTTVADRLVAGPVVFSLTDVASGRYEFRVDLNHRSIGGLWQDRGVEVLMWAGSVEEDVVTSEITPENEILVVNTLITKTGLVLHATPATSKSNFYRYWNVFALDVNATSTTPPRFTFADDFIVSSAATAAPNLLALLIALVVAVASSM